MYKKTIRNERGDLSFFTVFIILATMEGPYEKIRITPRPAHLCSSGSNSIHHHQNEKEKKELCVKRSRP